MSFALLYTDEIRLRALEPSDVDVLIKWKKAVIKLDFANINFTFA